MNNRTIGTLGAFALAFSAASLAQNPENERDNYEYDSSKQELEHTPEAQTEAQRQAAQMRHSGTAGTTGTIGSSKDHHQSNKLTAGQITSDQLISGSVTIGDDDSIGSVTDLVIDPDGSVSAVLVSVGGVMGIGGDTKALSWDDVEIVRKDDGEVDLRISMTEAQLENLPDFDSEWTVRTARVGSTD